ncbi:iron-regulated protein frpA [Bdellovibrio bacteriovorus]|uniref:iron-regulated protein frpA n=1 Tax=Bdellovibrio bacteriovorus TaxID=959 RepID=UPI0009B7104A|nr:iron-regulated protein frpA [Bdellovibrio bacteriovorus]
MNKVTKLSKIVLCGALVEAVVGCSQPVRFAPSVLEQSSLTDNVFGQTPVIPEVEEPKVDPFNPFKHMSDIHQGDDSMTPNIASDNGLNGKAVSNCDRVRADGSDRYEEERLAALAAAKADTSLIPVRFSVSAGSAEDSIALWSHQRTILRKDSNGVTPFYVGAAKKDTDACKWSTNCTKTATVTNHFHYIADHQQARQEFIAGEKCFFSTVRAIASVDDSGVMTVFASEAAAPADVLSLQNHSLRNLYYGESYENIVDSGSPRLFKKLGDGAPNIVSLYVADLRENVTDKSGKTVSILTPEFVKLSKSLTRGDEVQLSFKEIFNLRTLWTERDFITEVLSTQRTSKAGAVSAYEAVPQLIQWLVHSGVEGTAMSTKYTPLVLDLGVKNVRTSSLEGGSFFNLANIQAPVTHMTAWLGGNLVVRASENSINAQKFTREIDDGFLVVPNADGSITSSQNLFGSQMKVSVNGEEKTFANGFETLAALAAKDCQSEDPKKHYLGPWDGELYSQKIKVWVDKNRNAVADGGEVISLADAKVAAINACHVVYANEKDKYGNSTELRSPFLMFKQGESEVAEEELLTRLATGKDKDGQDVEFRLMVDIFFKAKPGVILENVDTTGLPAMGGAQLAQIVQ